MALEQRSGATSPATPLQTRILRPSRWRLLGLFIISVLFVVGLIVSPIDGSYRGRYAWVVDVLGPSGTTWVGIIFFGAGAIAIAIAMLPNSSYLKLSPEGFLICSLFRKSFVHWQDIGEFGVYTRRISRVGFNYVKGYAAAQTARRIAAGMTGFEGGLPDNYGMKPGELAAVMTEYLRVARATRA